MGSVLPGFGAGMWVNPFLRPSQALSLLLGWSTAGFPGSCPDTSCGLSVPCWHAGLPFMGDQETHLSCTALGCDRRGGFISGLPCRVPAWSAEASQACAALSRTAWASLSPQPSIITDLQSKKTLKGWLFSLTEAQEKNIVRVCPIHLSLRK